jgi:hypothetical protein
MERPDGAPHRHNKPHYMKRGQYQGRDPAKQHKHDGSVPAIGEYPKYNGVNIGPPNSKRCSVAKNHPGHAAHRQQMVEHEHLNAHTGFHPGAHHAKMLDDQVLRQINAIPEHRTYFLYWLTFCQLVVMIVAMSTHGLAPVDIISTENVHTVQTASGMQENILYMEYSNFWVGPSPMTLIRLGAKYSPCMRRDKYIQEEIVDFQNEHEQDMGCCMEPGQLVCYSTSKAKCTGSNFLNTWTNAGLCGGAQCCTDFSDPRFIVGATGRYGTTDNTVAYMARNSARDAATAITSSTYPSGDLTPAECLERAADPSRCGQERTTSGSSSFDDEGSCTRTGTAAMTSGAPDYRQESCTCNNRVRPCCLGVIGECQLATKEYCDAKDGYFHESKTSCESVDCFLDVCGMIKFNGDNPDQFFRVWTSLFLHAGIIQFLVAIMIEHYTVTDLERTVGCVRIGMVYLLGGMGANVFSSYFAPYQLSLGSSGPQFALVAAHIVEFLQNWQMLDNPLKHVWDLTALGGLAFIFGLLPYVDNWANLGGFLFGIFISLFAFPYITFGKFDLERKRFLVLVGLGGFIALLVIFLGLLYSQDVSPNWENDEKFNCVEIVEGFCEDNLQKNIVANARKELEVGYSKFIQS